MTELPSNKAIPNKKLLENPFVSSLVVPIAIVLIGGAIIFGVTKMLSTDRSYKDLVRELHSKTFGNRWIAAYELSKLISTSQIPAEDLPWLVENLETIYQETADDRTREFLTVAAGALRSPLSVPLLERSLTSENQNVKFHGLVAIGNLPTGVNVTWSKVLEFLNSQDFGLKQAAILALANHRVAEANAPIRSLLTDANHGIRYAAASALIYYQDAAALPVLQEILALEAPKPQPNSTAAQQQEVGFTFDQITNLKLNVVRALEKIKWDQLMALVEAASQNEQNEKVLLYERQILNKLKN